MQFWGREKTVESVNSHNSRKRKRVKKETVRQWDRRQSNKHIRWQLNRYLLSSGRKYNFTLCWAVISLQCSLCWLLPHISVEPSQASNTLTNQDDRNHGISAAFFAPNAELCTTSAICKMTKQVWRDRNNSSTMGCFDYTLRCFCEPLKRRAG